MSRKPRIYTNTGTYHVIMRGNDHQNLFLKNKDRSFFILRMQKYSSELKIRILNYCLMDNHVHLQLKDPEKKLSLFIQKLANSYVYYFNHKYERSGHLFQGRFKSEPVEDEKYYKILVRYILRNPQKAGIKSFDTYKWSSFSQLIDQNGFIDSSFTYQIFGAKKTLLAFIKEDTTDCCMEYENKKTISDHSALKLIRKITGEPSPYCITHMNDLRRIETIRILKSYGMSVYQIARLTGIARYVIKSA